MKNNFRSSVARKRTDPRGVEIRPTTDNPSEDAFLLNGETSC